LIYQINTDMKGYSDYLFILSPSDEIISKVRSLKRFCSGIVGGFESLHSKAHITVQPFPRKKPFWIDPVATTLEKEFSLIPSVTLQINGFRVFTNGDNSTIYARLNTTPVTGVWFKDVRRSLKLKKFEPHITIARSLTANQFKQLWPHFRNRDWNETFLVDRLTILQRETIDHDRNWKVFKEIPFRGNADSYYIKPVTKAEAAPITHAHYGEQVSLF
jgi:2'-5' RNA ligase